MLILLQTQHKWVLAYLRYRILFWTGILNGFHLISNFSFFSHFFHLHSDEMKMFLFVHFRIQWRNWSNISEFWWSLRWFESWKRWSWQMHPCTERTRYDKGQKWKGDRELLGFLLIKDCENSKSIVEGWKERHKFEVWWPLIS